MNHKHKGVLNSKGQLRMHPITRVHTDPKVQKWHNESTNTKTTQTPSTTKQTPIKDQLSEIFGKKPVVKEKEFVQCPVDKDGFINVDLDACNYKGMRIKFTRIETIKGRRLKRRVGLQINNIQN